MLAKCSTQAKPAACYCSACKECQRGHGSRERRGFAELVSVFLVTVNGVQVSTRQRAMAPGSVGACVGSRHHGCTCVRLLTPDYSAAVGGEALHASGYAPWVRVRRCCGRRVREHVSVAMLC